MHFEKLLIFFLTKHSIRRNVLNFILERKRKKKMMIGFLPGEHPTTTLQAISLLLRNSEHILCCARFKVNSSYTSHVISILAKVRLRRVGGRWVAWKVQACQWRRSVMPSSLPTERPAGICLCEGHSVVLIAVAADVCSFMLLQTLAPRFISLTCMLLDIFPLFFFIPALKDRTF